MAVDPKKAASNAAFLEDVGKGNFMAHQCTFCKNIEKELGINFKKEMKCGHNPDMHCYMCGIFHPTKLGTCPTQIFCNTCGHTHELGKGNHPLTHHPSFYEKKQGFNPYNFLSSYAFELFSDEGGAGGAGAPRHKDDLMSD